MTGRRPRVPSNVEFSCALRKDFMGLGSCLRSMTRLRVVMLFASPPCAALPDNPTDSKLAEATGRREPQFRWVNAFVAWRDFAESYPKSIGRFSDV